MALRKLSPLDLVAAIQDKIEENTGLRCYDHVPLNAESPFYFVEATRIQPSNTKTMYRDILTAQIHCIAAKGPSSVGVYKLIQSLDEALTEDIEIPEPFELLMQTNEGLQSIKEDETGEKHAIVSYDFTVCYGFICKL